MVADTEKLLLPVSAMFVGKCKILSLSLNIWIILSNFVAQLPINNKVVVAK